MTKLGMVVSALLVAALALGGCVSYSSKEPLVVVDRSPNVNAYADTQYQSTDTQQVRDLKTNVAQLREQVARLQDDLAKEKAKRKASEEQVKQLKDQLKRQ